VRSLFAFGFVAAVAFAAAFARADESRMIGPAQLVSFVVKAESYDRHFGSRANGHVHTLVVYKDGSAPSVTAARALVSALANTEKIGGLAHDQRAVPYEGANALASEIRSEQIAIVIISSELGSEAGAIAHELDGIDTLSVAVDPDDVPKGIVFGVDTRAGKPTLVVRLAQARRQNVAFEASLLKLARVE
jgi:hypothetical protein